MSKFQGAMRRVITGDNAQGESVTIIDGGPSSEKGNPDLGEMFEIWEDAALLHGDGSIALTPAVQYTGGVSGVGIGVTPCVISWVWYSGHVTSGGTFI
jgi:hypothetical protein